MDYSKYIDHDYMVRIRRQLHMYPELSFDIPRTLALIRSELEQMGVSYTEKYGKSSIVAIINDEKKDFTIAFRADTDALPITETNDVPYKSQIPGQMHACGHDVHTAALLGTVRALNAVKDQIACRLVFLFQSSEEGPSGAKLMTADGVCDEFDVIVSCHVDNRIDAGSILARDGAIFACADDFTITITGMTGHAAAPHAAKDALQEGVILYEALNRLTRETDPSVASVLTVTALQSGARHNIIPAECTLKGTLRTHSDQSAAHIRARIQELCRQIDAKEGFSCQCSLRIGYGAVVSDPRIAARVRSAAESAGIKSLVPTGGAPMYGEDFAYYAQRKPNSYFFLGTRNIPEGKVGMTHNSDFDVDETALDCAAKVFCSFVKENMNGIPLE